MGGGKSRKMGSGGRCRQNKRLVRGNFNKRHIDQVFNDFTKDPDEVITDKHGPVGTSTKVELDEDLPGNGKHFCLTCSKYFINAGGLLSHQKGKPHKRRMSLLLDHKKSGTKPHDKADAEAAGGMGPVDNGPKLRSGAAAVAMATE